MTAPTEAGQIALILACGALPEQVDEIYEELVRTYGHTVAKSSAEVIDWVKAAIAQVRAAEIESLPPETPGKISLSIYKQRQSDEQAAYEERMGEDL